MSFEQRPLIGKQVAFVFFQTVVYIFSKQALYKGLSFASIVGFGANGAVIHYR